MPILIDIASSAVDPPHLGGQRVIRDVNRAVAELGWTVEQFALGIRRDDLKRPFRTTRREVSPGYFEWRRTDPVSVLTFLASVALGIPNAWSDTALALAPWPALESAAAGSAAVLVESPWAFHPRRPHRPSGVPLVYMSQNVEVALAGGGGGGSAAREGGWLARRARRREEALLRAADLTVCITREDKVALCEIYECDPGRVVVVPRGIDLGRFAAAGEETRSNARRQLGYDDERAVALFVGSKHGPNREALDFMVRLARELDPAVRCVAAGSVAALIDDRQAGALWLRPGDPAPHLAAADIALNPMSSGSGMNVKMLEYFAAGLPVVTTPMGRRGIEEGAGEAFIVAELDATKAVVESLVADAALRRRIGAAGRRLVETSYSAPATARRLVALVESLARTAAS